MATREAAAPGANRLYRLFRLPSALLAWLLWPLAMVLCYLVLPWMPQGVPMWLGLTHYLCEHRLWRKDSGWRQHIRLG